MSEVEMVPAFVHEQTPIEKRVLVMVDTQKGQHMEKSALWFLDLIVDGQQVTEKHERIGRSYSSANDALVSARHLLREVMEGGGK